MRYILDKFIRNIWILKHYHIDDQYIDYEEYQKGNERG